MVFWGAWCRRGAPWATLTDKQPTVKGKIKKLGGFYHCLGWALEQSLNNQGTIIEQSKPQRSRNKWTITDQPHAYKVYKEICPHNPWIPKQKQESIQIESQPYQQQHHETVRIFFEWALFLTSHDNHRKHPLLCTGPFSSIPLDPPSFSGELQTHTGPNRTIIIVYDV